MTFGGTSELVMKILAYYLVVTLDSIFSKILFVLWEGLVRNVEKGELVYLGFLKKT